MKNKLTRKLMLSAFTLLFAVISLGASTYAWFTMSEDADVEAFTADVKAGEGIEIAVTSGESYANAQWYTGVVPSSVVQAAANPLTDGKTTFRFDAATTTDNAANIVDKAGDPSTGYIKFYVHIKAAQAGKISLDGITLDSKLNGQDPTPWTADAAYKLGSKNVVVNDQVTYEVENAVRISFKTNTATTIYEKAAAPVEGDKVADGVSTYVAGNQVGCVNTTGAFDYYNVKNNEDLTIPGSEPYETRKIDSSFVAQEFVNLTAPGTLTIEVKVWIEGWDAECLNAIFAQTLSVALSFKYDDGK